MFDVKDRSGNRSTYTRRVEFTGRVYFDVTCADVWRFYRFLAAAAAAGARLGIEWAPFSLEQRDRDRAGTGDPPVWETRDTAGPLHALAAYAWVRERHPAAHGAFLQTVLTAHHRDGADTGDWRVLGAAADAVGVDGADLIEAVRTRGEGYAAVGASHADATAREVRAVPTVVRWGPPLYVEVNPAALEGDVLARLEAIDAVLGDDGLWVLRKP
jgi:predicted DsbA family dithiol-disulfide isomerase